MSAKLHFLKPADENFNEDRSDADGTNHTSFIFNPFISQSIERQRKKLPVFNVRNHFLYLMENFQVVVVVGDTGSGKSTQLPQYLMESNWGVDGVIGIAEPRRVACTSLATRVSEEKECLLGAEVGYCIRFDDRTSEDQTQIKFMTEGILVREMMADPLLRQYSVIILDEVHERTLFTDVVLGLMKKILKRRKQLRLVVCSATIDADKFCDFFNFNKTKEPTKDSVSVLSIPGRMFRVDIHYMKDPAPDYVKTAVETVVAIHTKEAPGDVLVFLTGVEEIENCVDTLQTRLAAVKSRNAGPFLVVPMHGSLPNSEQLKAFKAAPAGTRKIIVSTNIAETSVTIPNIVYVVDCGFVRLRVFRPGSHSDALIVVPTSKASARQRAGRAGRTQSGKVYRLYKEEEFKKLAEATPPEMLRSNLDLAVLNMMALGVENMLRFDFPTPPPSTHLVAALNELYALGALTEDGALSDPLGKRMAELPLNPKISKMLLVSGEHECSEEILSIVAMLQVQSVFVFPNGKRSDARIMHRKFQVSEGDLLTLLNVYSGFVEQNQSKRWCATHFLNYKALLRATEMRNRMKSMYTRFGYQLNSSEGGIDPICRCITAGLFPNAAYLHPNGAYKTVRGTDELYIHPSSVLYDQTMPKWVLFAEVLHTTKLYMKDLTVIEEDWLIEQAPHFYEKGFVGDT